MKKTFKKNTFLFFSLCECCPGIKWISLENKTNRSGVWKYYSKRVGLGIAEHRRAECFLCREVFQGDDNDLLGTHLATEHEIVTDNSTELWNHFRRVKLGPQLMDPIKCQLCEKTFKMPASTTTLRHHLRALHGVNVPKQLR